MQKNLKGRILRSIARKNHPIFCASNASSVLILKYDRIGDMVVTTPIFREIKKAKPSMRVHVLSSNKNHEIIAHNPYVDKTYIKPDKNIFKSIIMLLKIRMQHFDICIDLEHSIEYKTIFILKIINPKTIISTYKNGRYGVKGSELEIYDHFTDKDSFYNQHFRSIYLQTIEFIGISPLSNKLNIYYTNKQKKRAIDFLNKLGGMKKIGVNLQGSWPGKTIHQEDLQKICTELHKIHNNIIIILITYPLVTDKIQQIIKNIGLPYVIPSYSTYSILDAAALIDKLDLIITPDTSITHIASAVDTPIVTIHENNKDTYRLMGPTSTLNRTVFAKTYTGIYDYSSKDVAKYGAEILNIIEDAK